MPFFLHSEPSEKQKRKGILSARKFDFITCHSHTSTKASSRVAFTVLNVIRWKSEENFRLSGFLNVRGSPQPFVWFVRQRSTKDFDSDEKNRVKIVFLEILYLRNEMCGNENVKVNSTVFGVFFPCFIRQETHIFCQMLLAGRNKNKMWSWC